MELLLCDLSFSNICMLPPKLLENNHYSFPLEYSNEEQKIPLIFTSNQLYHLYLRQNVCELHIKEKNELQFFNYKQKLRNSKNLGKKILSLPISEEHTKKEIIHVCKQIKNFFKKIY